MRSYDPKEFVALSKKNSLSIPEVVVLTGLTKEADDDEHLLFTMSADCSTWHSVPLSMIQSIQHLMNFRCKDHKHPVVRIMLRPVTELTPEAAFLASMLLQAQKSLALLRKQLPTKPPATHGDCAVVEALSGLQICCTITTPEGELEVVCTGMA